MLFLRHRGIGEPLLDVVHLGLDVEQGVECAAGLLEYGAALMREAILRQVADGEAGRLGDGSESGSSMPARIFRSVVLPAPLGPHNPTDPVARHNLPGDTVEQDAVSERLGEFFES